MALVKLQPETVRAAIGAEAPHASDTGREYERQVLSAEQADYAQHMARLETRPVVKGARVAFAQLGMPSGWGKTRLVAHHLKSPMDADSVMATHCTVSYSRYDRIEKTMERAMGDVEGADLVIAPEYLMDAWEAELAAAGVCFARNDFALPRPPVILASDAHVNMVPQPVEQHGGFRRLVLDEADTLRIPLMADIPAAFMWLVAAWPGVEVLARNAPAFVTRAVTSLARYGLTMADVTLGAQPDRARNDAVDLTIGRWARQAEIFQMPAAVVAAYAEQVGGFNPVMDLPRWMRKAAGGADNKRERMEQEECPVQMDGIEARCVCPGCCHAFDVKSILRARAHGNVGCPMCRKQPVRMTMQRGVALVGMAHLLLNREAHRMIEDLPRPMVVYVARPVGKYSRAMLRISLGGKQDDVTVYHDGTDRFLGRSFNGFKSLLIVSSTMCYSTRTRERVEAAMRSPHRATAPVIKELLVVGRCD